MSVENVKKFRKDLEENEEVKEKLKKELEIFKDSGKKEKELIPEIARKLGYDFTDEEFNEECSKGKELSDEEISNVSGGLFWFGEDAPDGHEIGCFYTYYIEWIHYYFTNNICPNCKSTNVHILNPNGIRASYICNDCGEYTQDPGNWGPIDLDL